MAPKHKVPQRKLSARLRQRLITACCYALGKFFALPFLRGVKPDKNIVKQLPPHARIVILKPCCLGDVMLSTPVIAALREAFPKAQLTYIVSQSARPAIANNPRLNEIWDSGFDGSKFTRQSYLKLVRQVRQGHYDLAIVLDRSPLMALLPWLAGIKRRAGLDSLGRGFAHNYKAKLKPSQPRHEAEVYLDVVRALEINPTSPQLEFYPGLQAQLELAAKAQEWGIDWQQKLAVIHPGGGQNRDTTVYAKRWPGANFGEIAARLLQQNVQVIVIGAASDRQAVQATLAKAAGKNLIDASEQLNIAQIGALLEKATLFVGNDTGLMHIAAASGTAVVAIFGPSSPLMYGPYTPKGRALSPVAPNVSEGLPLAEYQALSVEQGGITQVSVAEVWEAILEQLSEK